MGKEIDVGVAHDDKYKPFKIKSYSNVTKTDFHDYWSPLEKHNI